MLLEQDTLYHRVGLARPLRRLESIQSFVSFQTKQISSSPPDVFARVTTVHLEITLQRLATRLAQHQIRSNVRILVV